MSRSARAALVVVVAGLVSLLGYSVSTVRSAPPHRLGSYAPLGSTYLAANYPQQGFYGSDSPTNCTNGDPTATIQADAANSTGGTWNGTAGNCYQLTTATNGSYGIDIPQPTTVSGGYQLVINGNGSTIYDPANAYLDAAPTSVSGTSTGTPTAVAQTTSSSGSPLASTAGQVCFNSLPSTAVVGASVVNGTNIPGVNAYVTSITGGNCGTGTTYTYDLTLTAGPGGSTLGNLSGASYTFYVTTMTFASLPTGVTAGDYVAGPGGINYTGGSDINDPVYTTAVSGSTVYLGAGDGGHINTLSTSNTYSFGLSPYTLTWSTGIPSNISVGMAVVGTGISTAGNVTVSSITGNTATLVARTIASIVGLTTSQYRFVTQPLNPMLQISDFNNAQQDGAVTFPGNGLCNVTTGTGCNVVIENVNFVGNGIGSFIASQLGEVGIDLTADTDVAISNVQVWNSFGDGLDMFNSPNSGSVPCSDIQVNDFISYQAGRVSVFPGWLDNGTKANSITPGAVGNLTSSTFTNVDMEQAGYHAMDWETDEPVSVAGYIIFAGLTFTNDIELNENLTGPVTFSNLYGTRFYINADPGQPIAISNGYLNTPCSGANAGLYVRGSGTITATNLTMGRQHGGSCTQNAWDVGGTSHLILINSTWLPPTGVNTTGSEVSILP